MLRIDEDARKEVKGKEYKRTMMNQRLNMHRCRQHKMMKEDVRTMANSMNRKSSNNNNMEKERGCWKKSMVMRTMESKMRMWKRRRMTEARE